jgi:hypothetical protein
MKYTKLLAHLSPLFMALGVAVSTTGGAFAADDDDGYAPRGIHVGSFYVFPSVAIGIGIDDNIFRLPEENAEATGAAVDTPVSDNFVKTNASVTINSDWTRHAFAGMASVSLGKYDEFGQEDFGNYEMGIDGTLDIKRGIFATGKAGFRKKNEDRSSVDDREVDSVAATQEVFGIEPTAFSAKYVGVGFDYNPARLGFSFDLDYKTLDYGDISNINGAIVDNGDRNRSLAIARVRVGYEIMPHRSLYLEGNLNNVGYDQQADNNGIERSSSGYKTAVGMNFDLSNLLLGDVYVGYLEQDYDSPTQADISSNTFGAKLKWFPSRLTSVNLGLNQNVEESTEASASGYLSTKANIGINHELKRNIILSASVDHTENEFTQNAIGQKEREDITGISLGGKYLISRLLTTSLNVRREVRNSDLQIQEYTNNRAEFKIGAHW